MQLKLHRQARALAHLAAHDGLTGLFNRRHFDHMLAVEVARHFRHRESLALAIVDVDYFKPYNDHYGHPQGDECLRAVASILAECSQRAGDVLARYGGEEFAIIMPHVVPEQAELLGERLCAAVRERQIPHAGCARGQVTISVGISAGVPAANEPAICLLQADRAVYEAKHGGRDGWRLAPGKMGAMP
jgi:diguanylate cyclase (GGDEF)-like protein